MDHFTRYTWLYPLKNKFDVARIFPIFRALVENRFKTRLTTLYSDNGGEYIGLASYLAVHGISHLTSPPHTPEHNGIVERKHIHIVETGLSLLSHAEIPNQYWSYALAAAVFLINRMPTPILSNVSPYEALFHTAPNYTRLRVFGCLCYPWLRPYSTHKLNTRSTPCVFLGYSITQSAYLCLDVTSSKNFTSRHVEFFEFDFPYSRLTKALPLSSESTSSVTHPVSIAQVYRKPLGVPSAPSLESSPPLDNELLASADDTSGTRTEEADNRQLTPNTEDLHVASVSSESMSLSVTNDSEQVVIPVNDHPMITRGKNNIVKKNKKYAHHVSLTEVEPTSYTQALKDERWRKAMGAEIDSIVRNGTFTLVDSRLASNIVGNR